MPEHWPRLRVLSGLDGSDDEIKEVVQWLQEHHPEIDLMRTQSCIAAAATLGGNNRRF